MIEFLFLDLDDTILDFHKAERLAEVCYTFKKYNLEVKKIQFVAGRYGAKPYLVMVEAVKGGKPHSEIMDTIYNVK